MAEETSSTSWTSILSTTSSLTDGRDGSRVSGSWDDFKLQIAGCFLIWFFLAVVGVVSAFYLENEKYEAKLKVLTAIITASKIYLSFSTSLVFFLIFANERRRDVGEVSFAIEVGEVGICCLHSLESIILWLHAILKSYEELGGLTFGRLFIDCFVSGSVFIRSFATTSNLSFVHAVSLKLIISWRLLSAIVPSFKKMVLLDQLIELVCVIYFCAGIIQQCETLEGEEWLASLLTTERVAGSTRPQDVWTMSGSIYYVCVTVTTVGYGDMAPKTVAGQAFAIMMAPVGAWAVLCTLTGMAHAVLLARRSGGSYAKHRGTRPILLTGSPCQKSIWEVLSEIYHEDHYQEASQIDTIILLLPQQRAKMQEVKRLLVLKGTRQMQSRVFFVSGSPLNQADLKRARCDEALQAYVLPDIYACDPEEEDICNAMRVLSIHQFAPHTRIIAMMLNSRTKEIAKASGVEDHCLVCVDELKLQMLGKACRVPGFITLSNNLIKMAGESMGSDQDAENPWMGHYAQGLANELYEVYLTKSYRGAPFREVVMDILARSDGAAYLIGIIDEATHPSGSTSIHMFPGEAFRVPLGDSTRPKGVFISSELSAIVQIPEGKVFRWDLTHHHQSSGTAAATHPHAVPEDAAGRDVNAIDFYIPDPRQTAKEADKVVLRAMADAAQVRTAQGLKGTAQVQRKDIEEMLGVSVSKDAWDVGELIIEGRENITADDAEDPVTKAHLQLAKAEQQLLNARAKAVSEIVRERREISAVSEFITEAEEQAARLAPPPDMLAREKELDLRALGPLPTLPQLWGSPQEPPLHVLLRGGHILFLAIEHRREDLEEGNGGGGSGSSARHHDLPHGVTPTQPLGSALKLEFFLKAVRPPNEIVHRPVVVLADRVPADWPEIAAHGQVYLLTGKGLSAQRLKYAGLLEAHAVVIHQRGPGTADTNLADVEAIFAIRVVESLLTTHNKEVPLVCDLSLNESAIFLPAGSLNVKKEKKANAQGEVIDRMLKDVSPGMERQCYEREEQERSLPYFIRPHFVCGQLFVANAITCMVANLLYNPSLVKLIREFVNADYKVIAAPMEHVGRQFKIVFEHVLRNDNMLAIAILRRLDTVVVDDDEVDDEMAVIRKLQNVHPDRRWSPSEPRNRRYIFTAPAGTCRVAGDDALLCLVPPHKGPTRQELQIENLVV